MRGWVIDVVAVVLFSALVILSALLIGREQAVVVAALGFGPYAYVRWMHAREQRREPDTVEKAMARVEAREASDAETWDRRGRRLRRFGSRP